MWMKKILLERMTVQQLLRPPVCNAVITSSPFGFIVLAKWHGMMKHTSRLVLFITYLWYKIAIMCVK